MVQRATRGNAAALARAGIAFALSGNGLAPSVVHERVRQAIDAGLSADDALRALTITPARLLGVESAVGTIETGKIANLVVTRGDLFADDGRIVHVFVDGVRYEVAATVPVGRQAAARAEEGDRNADVEGLLRGAVPAAKDFAIRNATILTVTKGTIRNGTVVIRGGVITAVGARVPIPSDVQVIDGTGKYVMPGIIDAHSHMAVDGGNNESSESVVPEVVIPVRNDDPTIFRALAGGVTSALILHGSSDAIGGQGSVIKLRWGQPAESLYFRGANRIVKFALGENPTRASADLPDSVRRFPKSRMGVEQTLRESFLRARKYEAEWKAYRQAVKSNDAAAIEPRRDLRLEALADILRGDLKVHAHSYRGDEILMLMRVAEEFGFRIDTFQHALEAYKVADEIAKHGASVSTFAELWGYKIEAMDAIPYNMAILHSRGVMVSVNSDENERVRRLYQEAPIGMKYGNMTETEALEMITINPARQLGVADKVGSIEVGRQADLAIFNAHPFAPEAKVEKTLIDGRIYFDVEKVPTFLKLIQQTPASPARNDP
jgi:imidazolonepropionase-like amidohydrolase